MVNGVDFYTEGEIRMKVYFPEGQDDCRHCEFCWYSEPFGLFRCRLTNAYIEKAELNRRNDMCPVIIGGNK